MKPRDEIMQDAAWLHAHGYFQWLDVIELTDMLEARQNTVPKQEEIVSENINPR
jgi:hypothetical protein